MTAEMINDLHFLRPQWFWAVLPLILLLALTWRQRRVARSWRNVVDPRLLPHLLIGQDGRRRPWSLLVIALAGTLGITALAGPVWQKLEQPVFRQQSALVVLLDLSRSMDATDVRPSRLQRVRLKVHDIVTQRGEGQTALIAYAATPFVVSPLTSDGKTIASQLPSLTTDLMPAQGSRLDRAILKAQQLLQQAGVAHGSVLVVTDGVDGTPKDVLNEALKKLTQAGHRLLVLGVGSASGAPIPNPTGGFFTDSNGAIVVPKMNAAALRDLARQGHGIYRHMAADDQDITALLALVDADSHDQQAEQVADMMSDQWREEGAWLLLPLLLLAVFAFRRGYLVVVVAVLILPQSEPAYAQDWNSLWANQEQRAEKRLKEGDAAAAAEMFKTPQWRAAAQYRAGDYDGSLKTLQGLESAEADYNRGNALAQLGRMQEALNAYDAALKKNPQMKDAQFNRDLIDRLLKQQPQETEGQDGDDDQGEQGGDSDQTGDRGKNQQQSGEQQQGGGQDQPSQQQSGDDNNDNQQQAQSADDAAEGDGEETAQQQAMQQGEEGDKSDEQQPGGQEAQLTEKSEADQATEQWLRRIPDDPGGLWRRKFLYQYQRSQGTAGDEEQAW